MKNVILFACSLIAMSACNAATLGPDERVFIPRGEIPPTVKHFEPKADLLSWKARNPDEPNLKGRVYLFACETPSYEQDLVFITTDGQVHSLLSQFLDLPDDNIVFKRAHDTFAVTYKRPLRIVPYYYQSPEIERTHFSESPGNVGRWYCNAHDVGLSCCKGAGWAGLFYWIDRMVAKGTVSVLTPAEGTGA